MFLDGQLVIDLPSCRHADQSTATLSLRPASSTSSRRVPRDAAVHRLEAGSLQLGWTHPTNACRRTA